jgi:hypothetical protein
MNGISFETPHPQKLADRPCRLHFHPIQYKKNSFFEPGLSQVFNRSDEHRIDNITIINLPPNSLELNPTENLRHNFKKHAWPNQ